MIWYKWLVPLQPIGWCLATCGGEQGIITELLLRGLDFPASIVRPVRRAFFQSSVGIPYGRIPSGLTKKLKKMEKEEKLLLMRFLGVYARLNFITPSTIFAGIEHGVVGDVVEIG